MRSSLLERIKVEAFPRLTECISRVRRVSHSCAIDLRCSLWNPCRAAQPSPPKIPRTQASTVRAAGKVTRLPRSVGSRTDSWQEAAVPQRLLATTPTQINRGKYISMNRDFLRPKREGTQPRLFELWTRSVRSASDCPLLYSATE